MKDARFPDDRQRGWRAPLLAFTLGAAAFGLSRLAATAPAAVERIYATGLWPLISRPFSRLTGLLPFSLMEVLVVAYVIWTVVAIGITVRSVTARRRRISNAIAGGARRVALHAGLVIFAFYSLWGLNYARPSFEERQGWPAWDGADRSELIALAEQAVGLSNDLYIEMHGEQDAGEPTQAPSDTRELERSLDGGWLEATRLLSLQPVAGRSFGRVKRPLTSELIARLGITGIYSPFTAEAHVLRDVPAMRLPHTMAHEKAHQRGITGEGDASFLGFAASALSVDPLARYSAAMFAASQLLSSLAGADPEAYARISGSRIAGTRRDLADLAGWINRFRGVGDRVATAVNDRYLRMNRVPGGVANYGRSVRLMIEYSRRNDGHVLPHSLQPTRGQ
ncbi:MAG TPA: DUF3810 domain-containing protein [Longimicrobiales bacterium]|nr:DUF3810 domain-containing protein [Longimicrobiales bacterium]